MPSMNILVVTAGTVCTRSNPGSLTVIDNIAVALPPTLSTTWKMMEFGPPAVAGIPLMIPVPAARANPVGRVPEVTDQVKGVVPPVATRVWE